MILTPNFFVLTSEGKSVLPDSICKNIARNQMEEVVLYLDANVCLDVLNYFDDKNLEDDKIVNVEALLLFSQLNKISIVPKFGAMELSYNRSSQMLDVNKYQEMINKVIFAFDRPFDRSVKLNTLKYSYTVDVNEMDILSFKASYPLLLISYVTLLKLFIVCRENNPSENNIRQNLKRFCDWCDHELNTSMASEILLAIKIVSGTSEFKKMIALDKRSATLDDILKPIWGTAWDFFHMRMLHFSPISSELTYKTYFITQDKVFFSLFEFCNLAGAITFDNIPSSSFLNNELKIQYKNDRSFYIIRDIIEDFVVRRSIKQTKNKQFNIESLVDIKKELEYCINGLV